MVNLFRRPKKPKKERDQGKDFSHWENLFQIPQSEWLSPLLAKNSDRPESNSHYSQVPDTENPAIILGLGEAGRRIIKQFSSQVGADDKNNMQLGLIENYRDQNETQLPNYIKRINIYSAGITSVPYNFSSRSFHQACFSQAENYQAVGNFLHKAVKSFRSYNVYPDIHIVGSMLEPIIGICGTLLYLINDFHKGGIDVNVIMSFDVPEQAVIMDEEDVFASLRELSRFAINDYHVMVDPIQRCKQAEHVNLINHLFLIASPEIGTNEQEYQSFELSSGQAVSELLKVFISSDLIWERFSNTLTEAYQIQQDIQEVTVHLFGISTLYFPSRLFIEYAAARLMKEVIYRKQEGGHNLVFRAKNERNLGNFVRRWMEDSAYRHSFFPWLFARSNNFRSLQQTPPIEAGIVPFFMKKLTYHFNRYLHQKGTLQECLVIVHWVKDLLKQRGISLQENPRREQKDFMDFEEIIKQLIKVAIEFEREIQSWLEIFSTRGKGIEGWESIEREEEDQVPLNPFLKRLQLSKENQDSFMERGSEHRGGENPFETRQQHGLNQEGIRVKRANLWTFLEWIEKREESSISKLEECSKGTYRRSVIPFENSKKFRNELDDLYLDVVHSHVSDRAAPDLYYERIREKLGWNFSYSERQESVKLNAICLYHEGNRGQIQASKQYAVQDVLEFANCLYKLCVSRLSRTNVSLEWFQDKTEVQNIFFSIANRISLKYDRNKAAEYDARFEQCNIGNNKGYIFAKNETLANIYANKVFETLPQDSVDQESVSKYTHRITALKLILNVPIHLLNQYKKTYQSYKFSNVEHLYDQEKNAKEYEKQIRELAWEAKDVILAPQTTITLADINLVRAFIHALLYGVIRKQTIQSGLQGEEKWVVIELKDYSILPIASGSLWQAFREFVLVRPYTSRSRRDPDHPDTRSMYFQQIKQEIERRRRSPEFKDNPQKITHNLFAELKDKKKTDSDMLELIEIEKENLWRWN